MLQRIFLGLVSLLILAAGAQAKSWRGIIPARSNRGDVSRVLNQTIPSDKIRFRYESADEIVEFFFSGTESYATECEKALDPGTVLRIEITPTTKLHLPDLHLDETRLKVLEPSSEFIINGDAYADEDEGIVVTTLGGIVRRIVYIATKEDLHLCGAYYAEPRRFADVIVCVLCPAIYVNSPSEVKAGEMVHFAAAFTTSDSAHGPIIVWKVDAGTIVKGQGTYEITVDSTGLGGKTITATAEFGGFDPACGKQASASTSITNATVVPYRKRRQKTSSNQPSPQHIQRRL